MSRRGATWLVIIGAIGLLAVSSLVVMTVGGGRLRGGQSLTLASCAPKSPSGSVVNVTLSDHGGGMMGGGMGMMVSLSASPDTVPGGDVTFIVTNTGAMNHELLVLPLPTDGPGTRTTGTDGKINESSSLGEASTSCGRGAGDGISPGTRSWVTLHLAPGKYELLCDEPWHYANGMFAEIVVS